VDHVSHTQDEGRLTGVGDLTYNLISIAYHALQGVDTYNMFLKDAQSANDQECSEFIRQTMEEDKQRAERAVQLLARHLGQRSGAHG